MDWVGKWIWASGHSETPNFYMYARREFDIPGAGSATACVTCSTEYKLYVNGRCAGRGPSPCHPSFQYYDEYEIKHFLRPGRNVIAVLCYNYGVDTHCRPKAPGGFLLQADIANGAGDGMTIATDETWKVKPADDWDFGSARMFPTIGFQEVYDSRRKPVGWNVVGYDDSAWEEPAVIGEVGTEPWTRLVPREIPDLRESEVFPERVLKCGEVSRVAGEGLDIATRMYAERTEQVSGRVKYAKSMLTASVDAAVVKPGADSFVVLDFGCEVVGFPTIRIRDGGYAVLDVGYSEALDENGDVFPTRQSILQADRVILHGGRQEWESFGRRAFRYLQITFRDVASSVYIGSVSVSRIGYPVELASVFECSDELLNDIWHTGVCTLGACMQDAFEDCPLRERGQYAGDSRVHALMNYYSFFDTALAAKALRQFVQCQRPDGLFSALWPSSVDHILPDYNLVWVMMLHDYYLFTGDRALVGQLYPNMRLLLEDWAFDQAGENGLLVWDPSPGISPQEPRLFIDHAPLDKRGEVAAYNAFYYQALRDASKLASALDMHDDAMVWHARAESVLYRFNERLWSEDEGVYADCRAGGELSDVVSVHANMLAVLFGLADSRRCRRIGDYLASGKPIVESAGPYFNFYVLQAMARLGMVDEALALIRRDWGEMLRRGASTWWETFEPEWAADAICPDSLCHAWSGAPTYFLPAEILGVKPSVPGSGVVVIQPRVGDLEWAKGSVKIHAGHVAVEWYSSPDCFQIDIDAPQGFVVGLPVSRFENPQVEEIDLNPETPVMRARRTYGWGNVIWRDGGERDPYLDWLAKQEARPPDDYKPKQRCSAADGYVWVRETETCHVRYEVRESP